MDDEKLKNLQSFLLSHGLSVDCLSASRISQLEKVYDEVQRRKNMLSALKKQKADNAINVLAISKATGISRKTFYNNEYLHQFVEEAATSSNSDNDSGADCKAYIERINFLTEQVRKMNLRDLDTEKLNHRIAELSREIIMKDNRIRNLETEYETVKRELSELRSKIPINSATVIPFPSVHECNNRRIVSWNVNGITSCIEKGMMDYIQYTSPNIICLQEVKTGKENTVFPDNSYRAYWCFAKRKGYSGTALFTKEEPLQVTYGLGIKEFDNEGRLITAEFEQFFLINCYSPTSRPELSRIEFRIRWEDALRGYVVELQKKKPVIICGDLNVARCDVDVGSAFMKGDYPGISDIERSKMEELINVGFTDVFRYMFPKKENIYSWWPCYGGCRKRNEGLRLDYFLISHGLETSIMNIRYETEVAGSDHCPLVLEMNDN